jgi:bacillithiol synthase
MDCIASRLPYRQTRAFIKIVLDYIDQSGELRPFYDQFPSLSGIKAAISNRKASPVNRKKLVKVLNEQYSSVSISRPVKENIELLKQDNCFTITTAHQNNLFTGPLYVVYKIIHVIRLASQLNDLVPENKFVPVFYMGSEDADLQELNHIYLHSEKLEWKTGQQGAVGRMKTDKELIKLIDRLKGELGVLPFGEEIIKLVESSYKEGITIQQATFNFIHSLFADYGLVVLIADHPELKSEMKDIFRDDLVNQQPSQLVLRTAQLLSKKGYDLQANPREINLFYLKDGLRERITGSGDKYKTGDASPARTKKEIIAELDTHPEYFSPNVILRGLYQSRILPDICFVGGGGELAYWLELKDLFDHYKTPFPVLVLRNSFLVIEKKWKEQMAKLGISAEDLFREENELTRFFIERNSTLPIKLNGNINAVEKLYADVREKVSAIDSTLEKHVESLKTRTMEKLAQLEKKILRSEKRKYSDQLRQIKKIKSHLFPGNALQERQDNLLYYYATWGKEFIKVLLDNSPSFEQEFTVLTEC